jgi:archaellum component FlaC
MLPKEPEVTSYAGPANKSYIACQDTARISMNESPEQRERRPLFAMKWTKDVILLAFSIALIWRIAVANISLQGFSFNDLLSLLLAVFSVALSVAFYFKANETSNQFYHNTYEFTKDISELLGRIESGFGERLRHIEEGYSTMNDKIGKLPGYTGPTVQQVQTEEGEVERLKLKLKQLIADFANQAHVAENEKAELISKLSETSEELATAKNTLLAMKNSSNGQDEGHENGRRVPSLHIVLSHVSRVMKKVSGIGLDEGPVSLGAVNDSFEAIKGGLQVAVLRDMASHNLVDQDFHLTDRGKQKLKSRLEQISTI